MRMSNMFSRTLREAPSGAESKGYEYLFHLDSKARKRLRTSSERR